MNSEGSSDTSSIPIDDEEEEDAETRGQCYIFMTSVDRHYTVVIRCIQPPDVFSH